MTDDRIDQRIVALLPGPLSRVYQGTDPALTADQVADAMSVPVQLVTEALRGLQARGDVVQAPAGRWRRVAA